MDILFTRASLVESTGSVLCSMYVVIGVIQNGHMLRFIAIALTLGPFMVRLLRVFWMKKWFTSNDHVLTSLDKTSTSVLCSKGMCRISYNFNFAYLSLSMVYVGGLLSQISWVVWWLSQNTWLNFLWHTCILLIPV